jgi:hypothetical protein
MKVLVNKETGETADKEVTIRRRRGQPPADHRWKT